MQPDQAQARGLDGVRSKERPRFRGSIGRPCAAVKTRASLVHSPGLIRLAEHDQAIPVSGSAAGARTTPAANCDRAR